MKLEWDAAKAAKNLNKHHVSFEDAELVFYDPGRIEFYDGREDYGEDRWVTVGFAWSVLLAVAYTIREDETVRIFSARKATPDEQTHYRKANP
jgi:uncharacterized DUF497 family protein